MCMYLKLTDNFKSIFEKKLFKKKNYLIQTFF